MNWRKNENQEDILKRLGERRTLRAERRMAGQGGTRIDTSLPKYVEAVAKARESGRLYEGVPTWLLEAIEGKPLDNAVRIG